jgi:hypothetical protein
LDKLMERVYVAPTCHAWFADIVEEALPAGLFEAVDRGNVAVIQGGENLGFSLEPRQPFGVAGEFVGQDLDGDWAGEVCVLGTINLAHSTCTIFSSMR